MFLYASRFLNAFLVILTHFSLCSSYNTANDLTDLTDEEQQLIHDARKKLTEQGFNAVKSMSLPPKECDSLLISTVLNDTKEWELENMLKLLETECYPRHYKVSGYTILSPWISRQYIEEVFQNHTSSAVRVKEFATLISLIRKLSTLFLTNKIN
jgi:hypothetical protein